MICCTRTAPTPRPRMLVALARGGLNPRPAPTVCCSNVGWQVVLSLLYRLPFTSHLATHALGGQALQRRLNFSKACMEAWQVGVGTAPPG